MLEDLQMYLAFPFVRYALIVGVLISLCCALLGVILVPRQMSFASTGLSNLAFCATTCGVIIDIADDMLVTIPVTLLISWWLFNRSKNTDASISVLSSASLGVGYLLMNLFSGSANLSGDVCATLFGATSILTLSTKQVVVSVVLSICLVVLFIVFYKRLFSFVFDEVFMESQGIKVKWYRLGISAVVAVVIVLAMQLVGSLLVSALIVLPVLSAMSVSRSYKSSVIISVVLAVVTSLAGLLVAILWGTPVGSTIVAISFGICVIFTIIGKKVLKC